VAGLAGADPDAGREVGLAGAGRAEEHDVGPLRDEVEGAEMRDLVAFEAALEAVVEVLERFAVREACATDADLASVVLTRRDLSFETRSEVVLMGPALGSGPVREP